MTCDIRRVKLAARHHADLFRQIASYGTAPRIVRSGITPREERIIAAVKEAGSQVEAARMLGVSRTRVCHVMRLARDTAKAVG